MQDRLEYAERRLEEEIKNGEMRDIQYWRGYRDAVKRMTEGKMYKDTFKGRGCAKCPANQWECDAQYRSLRCEILREKARMDFDPDNVEKQYVKIKSCPKCGSTDLRYLWIGMLKDIPVVECWKCGWDSMSLEEEEDEK